VRVEPVAQLDDPRVALYRNLRDAALRSASDVFLVEGRLNVARLIDAPRYRTRSVFVTRAALRGIERALARLDAETPVYLASQALMDQIVGYPMHRGCLAVGERGPALSLDALLASPAPPPRRIAVLEDVSNPDNVGGVFRNALAFGVDAVLLTPRCADPLYRKALRVSMGAVLCVPFARTPELAPALRRLRAAGFRVLALCASRRERPLAALGPLPERVAWLLGAEQGGLSAAARAEADLALTIPMAPGIDSLNVATAAGIAFHHVAPQSPEPRAPCPAWQEPS